MRRQTAQVSEYKHEKIFLVISLKKPQNTFIILFLTCRLENHRKNTFKQKKLLNSWNERTHAMNFEVFLLAHF